MSKVRSRKKKGLSKKLKRVKQAAKRVHTLFAGKVPSELQVKGARRTFKKAFDAAVAAGATGRDLARASVAKR